MPPVFGPVSPSPTRLKSCADARGTAHAAVGNAHQRDLWSRQALLDHDGAAGLAERLAGELGPDVGGGLVRARSVTRTPLPAASPSVFTT